MRNVFEEVIDKFTVDEEEIVYDKYKKMKSRIFDRFEFSFMYVVMVKSKEKLRKRSRK